MFIGVLFNLLEIYNFYVIDIVLWNEIFNKICNCLGFEFNVMIVIILEKSFEVEYSVVGEL